MTEESHAITVAYGDGIGPEIMEAVLSILRYAKVPVRIETIEVGAELYRKNYTSGISESAWESIHRTKVLLKAPITTPQGGGYKSLNVTLRNALGLYTNVRPCKAYAPYVTTNHPDLDVVIIRENSEDLYVGIEHQHTANMAQSLKLVSHTASERIIRYAFEYAKQQGRRKVTCFSKDNIMKMTDGLFHKHFDTIAAEYPDIENQHMIIDIATAKMAAHPEMFDVVVTSNLYGDIVSDVAAELSGSVGMAGSANIGDDYAMFEAIHGSAPDIAGKQIANPSGLLHAAIMMLVHMGLNEKAALIHNAWLATLDAGIHTADIFKEGASARKVSTNEFAEAVIAHLGKAPTQAAPVRYQGAPIVIPQPALPQGDKMLVGVDVFVDWRGEDGHLLAARIHEVVTGELQLQMMSCRGLSVWPNKVAVPTSSDHWRCRFVPANDHKTTRFAEVLRLLSQLDEAGIECIKTDNLYFFDGHAAFSLGHGE